MIKLLEENVGENFHDIGLGNDFLHVLLKTEETKVKINKWDFFHLKSLCTETKQNRKSRK